MGEKNQTLTPPAKMAGNNSHMFIIFPIIHNNLHFWNSVINFQLDLLLITTGEVQTNTELQHMTYNNP